MQKGMHCLCNCPHHTPEDEAMEVPARQLTFSQTREISRPASTAPANYPFCLSADATESRDQNGTRNLLSRQEKPRSRLDRRPLHFIILESAIIVLAATTLGLASAYGVELLRAPTTAQVLHSHFLPQPLFPDKATTLNNIHIKAVHPGATEAHPRSSPKDDREYWVVIYSGTMPVLSIIFALLGLYLCFVRKLTSRYCIVVSMTLLIGWCIMLGWWVACDFGVPFGNRGKAPKSMSR